MIDSNSKMTQMLKIYFKPAIITTKLRVNILERNGKIEVLSKETEAKKKKKNRKERKKPNGNFRIKKYNWNKMFTGLTQWQNGDDRGVGKWMWK